jgi:hypothetical protein
VRRAASERAGPERERHDLGGDAGLLEPDGLLHAVLVHAVEREGGVVEVEPVAVGAEARLGVGHVLDVGGDDHPDSIARARGPDDVRAAGRRSVSAPPRGGPGAR